MPYHHGNLREALVEAAFLTAREEGPDAVVLRAATRAAGVSPNAAYRHFADREELLTAVAERCTERLGELMIKRMSEVPEDPDPVTHAWTMLTTSGLAYIEFARTETGWFRTAFGTVSHDPHLEIPNDPYGILTRNLDRLVEVGALPAERRPGAEYAAWAAVHGISALLTEGPLADLSDEEKDGAINKVLEVVAAGL
jgi:AcrR family transcriptional regulator